MTFLLELAGIREPWSGCVSPLVFFFFLCIFWLAGRDVTQRACLSTPRLLASLSVPVRLRCTPSGSKRQSLMLPSRVLNELSLFMNIQPLSPVSTARPALNESMRFCVFTWARGHTLLIFTVPSLPVRSMAVSTSSSYCFNRTSTSTLDEQSFPPTTRITSLNFSLVAWHSSVMSKMEPPDVHVMTMSLFLVPSMSRMMELSNKRISFDCVTWERFACVAGEEFIDSRFLSSLCLSVSHSAVFAASSLTRSKLDCSSFLMSPNLAEFRQSPIYTTTVGHDPAAGHDLHLHYWVVYAEAVDFTPVMFWTIDGEVIITPTNAPPVDGDGQHNYSPSSYTYTLQKKSNVQMQCHTTFEVQNTDKDDYVATRTLKMSGLSLTFLFLPKHLRR